VCHHSPIDYILARGTASEASLLAECFVAGLDANRYYVAAIWLGGR
jgi:hypothetical protein